MSAVIKQILLEIKYNKDNLNKRTEKVDLIERKELFQNNEKKQQQGKYTAGVYIQQNTSKHIRSRKKKLDIPQINPEFRDVFVNKPTKAFKRNKNIQDLISGHLIKDGESTKTE